MGHAHVCAMTIDHGDEATKYERDPEGTQRESPGGGKVMPDGKQRDQRAQRGKTDPFRTLMLINPNPNPNNPNPNNPNANPNPNPNMLTLTRTQNPKEAPKSKLVLNYGNIGVS